MMPTATNLDEASEFLKQSGGPSVPKLRLVVIEDDWGTHGALRRIFTALGWEVESALTVAGGLALLDHDPDALILDLILPDGDGLDVLKAVRLKGLKAKVVVATGDPGLEQIAAIRSLRPDALIRKPIELDAMIRALGEGGKSP